MLAAFILAFALVNVLAIKSIADITRITLASVAALGVDALRIPIAVIVTLAFVDVGTLLSSPFPAWFATASVSTLGVCADRLWVAIVTSIIAFVDIFAIVAIARVPCSANALVATKCVKTIGIGRARVQTQVALVHVTASKSVSSPA
jgi:hypothetical protein